MAIHFFSEETSFTPKNKLILKKWIKSVIVHHKNTCGDINFIFATNEIVLDINRKYLLHDYFTDIITFNYNDGKMVSGDIYISVDTVRENSNSFNTPFENEIHRVMIHGILHLIGFNDQSDSEKIEMRKKEDEALKSLVGFF